MSERRRAALQLVVMMGVVSLFADVCYEGMRSAVGPYLAQLGASGTAVGVVAGTGELLGYALRYLAGRAVDRSGRYWTFTFIGYATNLIAAPLLALAGSWPAVAALVALERLGKAIRSPAKSTLVSFAAVEVGAGWTFGLHKAMDQLGAVLGPLVVVAVLAGGGGYPTAFVLLGGAAVLSIVALVAARWHFPDPRHLEGTRPPVEASPRRLGWYLAGVALVGAGLADWALLSFDLARRGALAATSVIAIYAGAMAISGVTALAFGAGFDRLRRRGGTGIGLLAGTVVVGAASTPLALLGRGPTIYVGLAVWAATTAAVDAIARAGVATLVPAAQRGRAYGLYYAVFGVAWWLGSLGLGIAYDRRPAAAAILSATLLLAGAAVLAVAAHRARTGER